MVLAVECCMLRKILAFPLVIDRHSNFMIGCKNAESLKYRLFMAASTFTIRNANLTVVTNRMIQQRIDNANGNAFVLTDPLPSKCPVRASPPRASGLQLMLPSSWAADEPIIEVAEVCKILFDRIKVFVTGKPNKLTLKRVGRVPNFITTGFLSYTDYIRLMAQCDCVMPLTTYPEILTCGSYESLALGKPMILGDTQVQREFYVQGAVFTSCTTKDLKEKIEYVGEHLDCLTVKITQLYHAKAQDWQTRFSLLQDRMKLFERIH